MPHREGAKIAKKVGKPAHEPLTMRFMPSLIGGHLPVDEEARPII